MLAFDTENIHPATLLCLDTLQSLADRDFFNILDVGCGSGILSATAANIWPHVRITAADISPKAVGDTEASFARHELQNRAIAMRSDGFSNPRLASRGPYDLILCNLLAGVLFAIAPDVKKHLKTDGYALFGGIMAWQAAEFEQGYIGLGFEIIEKTEHSPWMAYILCHKRDT